MAELSVRGYVNKPQARTGNGKSYSTFTVASKQKGRNGQPDTRAYFNVVDFNNSSPPPESSFVTVKGYLTVREVEKDGRKFTNLDVVATEVEVAEPQGQDSPPNSKSSGKNNAKGKAKPAPAKETPDPWDDTEDASEEE